MNTPLYELSDGEVTNAKHPETFEIPDETKRRDLQPGDGAKLIFLYSDDTKTPERMWVSVTGKDEDRFTGVLVSKPLADGIETGDEVTFEARHVIDVYPAMTAAVAVGG